MSPDTQHVTVVMPVHNGEAYLRISVASVLNQTHRHFEFIIVNDGSTDRTGSILAEFAALDDRIRIVEGERRGIPAALNQALSLATGNIVFRIDHDDIAWPERIERQLAFLSENPGVAVVGSAIEVINQHGWPIRTTRYPTESSELKAQLERGINPLASPATAMRRDAVMSVGGFHSAFRLAQDYDLWCRLSKDYELANLPEILLSYRWHGQNITRRQRYDQVLAAHIARLAFRERREGRLDPTIGLDALHLGNLGSFGMPAAERSPVLLEIADAGLTSFKATGEMRYLDEAERCMELNAAIDINPRRSKLIESELAQHLWKAGRQRSSLKARRRSLRSKLRISASVLKLGPGGAFDDRCVADWIVRCADPRGPQTNGPQEDSLSRLHADDLICQADAHGVLPAVLRFFPWEANYPGFTDARKRATLRYRTSLSVALMLRQQADELAIRIAHLPAAIIKGPVFAHALYPDLGVRLYGDIDILAAPAALPDLSSILGDQGFEPADPQTAHEWKWVHRDNAALLVELQTNLVHAASLQHAVSLPFDVIAGQTGTPAGLLLVAVVHGAVAHFEQLRSLVDICQAARNLESADDERAFEVLVSTSGARFCAISGLELAGRIFSEPRCLAIARGLGPAPFTNLARKLLTRDGVMATMTSRRWLYAWRRQAFRHLIKQQVRR